MSLFSVESGVAPVPALLGYMGKAAPKTLSAAAQKAKAARQAKILAHMQKRCAAMTAKYNKKKHPGKRAMQIYQKNLAKCAALTPQSVPDSSDDIIPGPTAAQKGYAKYCDDNSVPTCFDDTYPDGNGNCDDQSTPMCDDGSIPTFPALEANMGTNIPSPNGPPTNFVAGACTNPPFPPGSASAPVCCDNSVPTCDDGKLPDSNGNCKNPNDTGPWCHNGNFPNWVGTSAPLSGMSGTGLGAFDSKQALLLAAGAVLIWYFFVRKG